MDEIYKLNKDVKPYKKGDLFVLGFYKENFMTIRYLFTNIGVWYWYSLNHLNEKDFTIFNNRLYKLIK